MPLIAAEILFVLCWSSGFVAAELAVRDSGPLTTLSLRLWLAGLLLLPVLFRAWSRLRRVEVRATIWEGLAAQGLWLACVYQAIALGARPGDVALIAALQPLLTAALAGWLLKEGAGPLAWVGLLLGLIGTGLVVAPESDMSEVGGSVGLGVGHVVALGAVITMTFAILARRRRTLAAGGDPVAGGLAGLALQFLGSAAVLTPLAIGLEGFAVDPTPRYLVNMVWQVAILSLASYGLLWLLVDRGGSTRASSLFYFTPAVTVAMAALVLGDPVGRLDLLGLAIALVGVLLVRFPVGSRSNAGPAGLSCR